MANPRGRTYHLGEHAVAEPGGLEMVYRDPEWERRVPNASGIERPWERRERAVSSARGWVGDLVRRYPVATMLGVLAVGLLTARRLSSRA